MTRSSGVAGGSLMMIAARVIASACAFILFWVISQISVGQLGAFRTIFVFFIFTEFLPLLGMQQYVIREISVLSGQIKSFIFHAFIFSLIIALVIIAGLLAVAIFGNYSSLVSGGLLLVACALPATAATLCLQSALIGLGRGAAFGFIHGLETIIRTISGIILIYSGQSIIMVVVSFIAIRWLIVAVYWLAVSRHCGRETWRFDPVFFRNFLNQAPIFAGILVLFLIIRFAAQLMLPWMKGDEAAGFFAVAYQFLDLALLMPTAFIINLLPVFSQQARVSLDELNDYCQNALKVIALVIIPAVVVVFMQAEPIVLLIFKKSYLPSVLLLRIIIGITLLLAIDQIFSTAMIASGRQKTDLLTLSFGATVILLILWPLISFWGTLGAAAGYFAGVFSLVVARILLARSFLKDFNLASQIWRPVVAGLAAAAIMAATPFYWLINICLGLSVYLFLIILLGAISKEQRKSMSRLFETAAAVGEKS
jgi:O-antigen/teichoic acid export membrane protein